MNIIKLNEFIDNYCTLENYIYKTKTLYSKSKNNSIRLWFAEVITSDNTEPQPFKSIKKPNKKCFYRTISGMEGGKQVISEYKQVTGKNLTKKNETNCLEQGILSVKSLFESKIKSGAVLELIDLVSDNYENIINRKIEKPWEIQCMFLGDFKKQEKKINYPCYVQTKMDGVHLTITYHEGVKAYFRGMKDASAHKNLLESFEFLANYESCYIVGELCVNGENRQNASSVVMQTKTENIKEEVTFYIFDMFYINNKKGYEERLKDIQKLPKIKYTEIIEAIKVNDKNELMDFYNKTIENNEEGIIIRNIDSPYEYGISKPIRSNYTLKLKPRFDSEFEIVDFTEGKGTNKGLIIFICKANNKTFSVNPKQNHEIRKQWFEENTKDFRFKGKMATIEYDSLSDDGIPIQPVLVKILD